MKGVPLYAVITILFAFHSIGSTLATVADFDFHESAPTQETRDNLRSTKRRAEIGDFERFNQLFENARIAIPGVFDVNEKLPVGRLEMSMWDIKCYDISIGDVTITNSRPSYREINVDVNVMDLDLVCELAYSYKYKILGVGPRGDGTAKIYTDNNGLSTVLGFTSRDFKFHPPTSSSALSCTSDIRITNIDFFGDFVSDIVEWFERFIRRIVEKQVESLACEEFAALGTSFVGSMLDVAEETLDEYQGNLSPTVSDPLYVEETAAIPDELVPLNLMDTESTIGQWFNQALEQVDGLLGSMVPDPNGPLGDRDLGVNKFMRDSLLNEQRELIVDIEQLPMDAVIFKGHDKLTETTMTLMGAKVMGLDTLTLFNPLDRIGNYTLQTEVAWDRLSVEFDIAVDIKPSSETDSLLEGATSSGVTERIKIDFGVDDVVVDASMFVLMDQEVMGAMEIGSLLHTDNIIPCLLSILHTLEVSGLDVNSKNINPPTLTGFVSPGIDRVVSNSVQAVYGMYAGVLTNTIPNIFQTSIREFINERMIETFLLSDQVSTCPQASKGEGFVDFRDLLLPPSEAIMLGATGNEPYGDLAYTAFDLLKKNLLSVDRNGLLDLNSFLIDQYTESQSGVAGRFQLPSDLISLKKTGFANEYIRSFVDIFQIGLSNLRISNLGILKPPVSILGVSTEPHMLKNVLTMGPVDGRPLDFTVEFMLALHANGESPLEMRSQVDVSMSFESASLTNDLIAKIDEDRFLSFPLQDVLKMECWLATIPPPLVNEAGIRLAESDVTLSLPATTIEVSGLGLGVNFINTTSSGTAVVPRILQMFKDSDSSSILLQRMNAFGEEFFRSDMLQRMMDRSLLNAPASCPHSPQYDPDKVQEGLAEIPFPMLSVLTIDSLFYAAALVTQIAFLMYVEEKRLEPLLATDPLSTQQTMNLSSPVLDWSNLGGRAGAAVDSAISAAVDYLGSPNEDHDGELGANVLVKSWLLNDTDHLTIVFEDASFELPGVIVSLNSLNISGLDSFSELELWKPLAPQTIQNSLKLDKLRLELGVDVHETTSREVRQQLSIGLSVTDLQADISLFLAMNSRSLESLSIGSFMNTTNIVPCLLSAVDVANITQIRTTFGNVENLIIKGLMPESQRSVDEFTETVMNEYRPSIMEAIPKLFDSTVRGLLDGLLQAYTERESCPEAVSPLKDSAFINFEEFFDDESDVYGDLPSLLRNLVDNELVAIDPKTGQPRINENLIVPFTRQQSGEEGTLLMDGDIINILSKPLPQFGINSVQLRASNSRIENVDSLIPPLRILNPNSTNNFILDNSLTLAPGPDGVKFTTTGLLAISGDPNLSFHNELELSVDLEGTEMVIGILAKVDVDAFFQFPLADVTNSACWFSLFRRALQGSDEGSTNPALSLASILLSIPNLTFQAECSNCSSPGLSILPEVLNKLAEAGMLDLLKEKAVMFGLDVLESDSSQAYLNRLILDGALQCPHSAVFQGEQASSEFPVPSFPSLSYSSVETLAFTATTFLALGTIIIAESHSPEVYVPAIEDMSGSDEIDALGARLIDFSSLETSIGEWADSAVRFLLDYLTKEIDDALGPNGKDIMINNLVRSAFLDRARKFELDFNGVDIGGVGSNIALKSVSVSGLDTIRSVGLLEVVSPQTVQNQLQWETLGLEVVLSLRGASQESNDLRIKVDLSEVNLSAALLLAVDLDLLGSLTLGSMTTIENIFPCFVSAARLAKLTDLRVSVGSISAISIDGFMSTDIAAAVDNVTNLILETYANKIVTSLPNFFNGTIRAILNNLLIYFLNDETNTACPISAFNTVNNLSFIDFRDLFLPSMKSKLLGGSGLLPYGDLFERVLALVKDLVFDFDEESGLSKVNSAVVAPFTRSQSKQTGSLIFPGDLFSGGSRIRIGGLDARVQLVAGDARIDHLDTIGAPMDLIVPIQDDGQVLNNTLTFGAADRALSASLRLLFSLVGDDNMQLKNDVNLRLDLSQATVVLGVLLKIAEERFSQFPLRDILDLNCWIATMPAPQLDEHGVRMAGLDPISGMWELAASIAALNIDITCNDCSSPRMEELTKLLDTDHAQKAATELANKLLALAIQLLGGDFLQLRIDRALADAARKCPHRPEYDPEYATIEFKPFNTPNSGPSTTFLVLLGGATVGLLFCTGLLMFVIKYIVRRRHRRWLSTMSDSQVQRILKRQDAMRQQEALLDDGTHAMVSSPAIPVWIRYSMPVIILGNIAFFLSGHLSLGATVNIVLEFAGEKIVVENFFEFSMARSTVDIWNAGGRELAILILIFSGIWPYTKQIITLVLWFLPPSRVSVSRRGSILLWLDWLAKWSMIDIFVLVISIAAFRVSIQSPDVGFLPENFYSIDLLVVPLWGLYANMTAQLISQISSHFIIHYHRKIITSWERSRFCDISATSSDLCEGGEQRSDFVKSTSMLNKYDEQKFSMTKYRFNRPHRGDSEKLIVRNFVNRMLCAGAFVLMTLFVVGATLSSFSLKILGLIGLAVESGQRFDDATTNFNVFTVVQLLLGEAKFLGSPGDWVGLSTLSMLFLFTVLVIPIIQCFTLLWQWFGKTSPQQKSRILILIEVLQAWQYAEVYLIAIFVASWQLGPVSDFMVNVYCRSLQGTFSEWVYFGLLKAEDAQCFSVESNIEGGFYVLILAAILLAVINTFVNKAVIQYFRDEVKHASLHNCEVETIKDCDISVTPDKVEPVPVLFSDTFRWLLRREDDMDSCSIPTRDDIEKREGDLTEDSIAAGSILRQDSTQTASLLIMDSTSDDTSQVDSCECEGADFVEEDHL